LLGLISIKEIFLFGGIFSIFFPLHGVLMEAVNMLSDHGGDVDDDWHYECLAEEDAEGFPRL